jgi:flagellar protein FlgJ
MPSVNGMQSRFALDVQGFEKLKNDAAKDPNSGLKEAATQFESMMVNMMLKSMRDAGPKSDMLGSQQMDAYSSMMDQQWSQHIAAKGIGIADMMIDQMQGDRRMLPPEEK